MSIEPMIKTAYDSIWIVTDLLMKYTYFLLYKERSMAEQLVYAFQRTVVAIHGMLEIVVIDRGLIYISKFWQMIIA